MDSKVYSNMYEINYKKPNSIYNHITHVGGNDEEEAIANATNEAVEFHNKYSNPKITAFDVEVIKVENVGEYNKVRRDLERG